MRVLNSLFFVAAISASILLTGCGGSGGGDIANPVAATQNSIIAESVKMVKNGDDLTISYQTQIPVQKSSVVTSGLSFNGAPLWSDFHETTSNDGLNHAVTMKAPSSSSSFMIYNSSSDKYDNNGKGLAIK